jgi:hypothetical protein
LILGLVVASADLASGTHNRPVRKNSTAGFAPGFVPPDAFKCEWVNRRDGQDVHDYECSDPDALPGALPFRLQEALVRAGNPPGGDGWDGLAKPGKFSCERDGSGNQNASNYHCRFQHKQGDPERHIHTFRVDEIVSVSDDEQDTEEEDIWYPPHRHGAC